MARRSVAAANSPTTTEAPQLPRELYFGRGEQGPTGMPLTDSTTAAAPTTARCAYEVVSPGTR
jgi:hypothetical protein